MDQTEASQKKGCFRDRFRSGLSASAQSLFTKLPRRYYVTHNLLFSCPLLAVNLSFKMVVFGLIISVGCLISLLVWIFDLHRLLTLTTKRKNIHRWLLWCFLVPGLNLLWTPWALIFANRFVKQALDKHETRYLDGPGAGVSILSLPLLILCLFWGTILLISYKVLLQMRTHDEIFIYASIVIVCILIVFVSYLVYFSIFVYRLGIMEKRHTKR